MSGGQSLEIGPDRRLTIGDVVAVARDRHAVRLSDAAGPAMLASRAVVDRVVAGGETVYGITTGFGDLANVRIAPDEVDILQRNLVRSHAAAVGEPLGDEVVRAMLLLRAAALARGMSGIRPVVVEQLLAFLHADLLPIIPSRGSVGASGDLAPLAHLALGLIGEGGVRLGGEPMTAVEALQRTGLVPLSLTAKEGLALLNGTQLMAAIGCLAVHDAERLARTADLVAAMSIEALHGSDEPFAAAIHDARPHHGQRDVATAMRHWLADSPNRAAHRSSDHRVQDPYSLRCVPQVHGAVRESLAMLHHVLDVEINSATDNPLVVPPDEEYPDGAVLSGGNFHGEPLALPLDLATMAVTELASISERRTARLVDASLSGGLPAFLTSASGRNSGYMVVQYTAAALVNELQTLSHPSSVHSLPTSANQEDHVSMGATSALHLRLALDHAERVIAIEALCAAQGIDFLSDGVASGIAAAHEAIRAVVLHLDEDRSPAPDIEHVIELVHSGSLLDAGAMWV
ncbi:MAG: histidine ammonia-lyase [Candidatus Limnocylindria bacterium]